MLLILKLHTSIVFVKFEQLLENSGIINLWFQTQSFAQIMNKNYLALIDAITHLKLG